MYIFEQMVKNLPIISTKWGATGIELLAENERFINYLHRKEEKSLSRLRNMRKALVISDVNIGDAIIIQSCIEVLRYYFPECEIDYIYSKKAHPLIAENPNISNIFPLFQGHITPSRTERVLLHNLFKKRSYDLIVNMCPFLSGRDFKYVHCPVLFPLRLVANIVRAQSKEMEKANLAYKLVEYINDVVSLFPARIRPRKPNYTYSGNKIYLSKDVFSKKKEFMRSVNLSSTERMVFFMPDASNRYSFIPEELQLELVEKISFCQDFDFLLLGAAFTFSGIEKVLRNRVPDSLKKKVVIIPKTLPIDVYACLVDDSEVFISGDTGMMHIASANKNIANRESGFKNSTAIVSIFGATEPQIYGYDSFRPEYIPSSQNAPAKVFEARPGCKNITCSVQRIVKKCSLHKCFQGFDINDVAEYVKEYLFVRNSVFPA